jgi:hypothetical protein
LRGFRFRNRKEDFVFHKILFPTGAEPKNLATSAGPAQIVPIGFQNP